MKNVIFVSGHFYNSKRKAGFHQIADAFVNSGNKIVFVTAPYSLLFKLKKNHYSSQLNFEKNKLILERKNAFSYVHYTFFHIANFKNKFLNFVTQSLYKFYQRFPLKYLKVEVENSDLIIFESAPGLFLFDKFKKINSKAKYIYRVSDDLENLNVHPSLIKYEHRILSQFDLVSVPSQFIYDKLFKIAPNANLKLHYHGLKKEIYDLEYNSPYPDNSINAIFVGVYKLDYNFLNYAASNFKNITFHIIGPLDQKVKMENIKYYGEMPFEETIPFVKYANIGLHTIIYSKGAESFTDSLKVHQYTYCGLPIIAPDFLRTDRKNMFYYRNESDISLAIIDSLKFKNFKNLKNNVITWAELKTKLLND